MSDKLLIQYTVPKDLERDLLEVKEAQGLKTNTSILSYCLREYFKGNGYSRKK